MCGLRDLNLDASREAKKGGESWSRIDLSSLNVAVYSGNTTLEGWMLKNSELGGLSGLMMSVI